MCLYINLQRFYVCNAHTSLSDSSHEILVHFGNDERFLSRKSFKGDTWLTVVKRSRGGELGPDFQLD